MFENPISKQELYQHLQATIDHKISTLQIIIASIEESRNNETKSSVGDKYETGRAMMQNEIAQNKRQLHNALQIRKTLSTINIEKTYSKSEFGACVRSNKGIYFLSVGLGKVELNNQIIYAISLDAPISKALYGKTVGESVNFQGQVLTIEDVW